ncbi:hypothetical protein D1867_05900 [Acidianus infernus]|uniref:Thermopsin n=1 Tax=Acidianus infernus TaxID=12915 RepID=A0A6A9QET6_ACIIN|nr:hypothetical protein [Acidianus infernus]MUM64785.1 hypothetical protein [Acidianus infernus]
MMLKYTLVVLALLVAIPFTQILSFALPSSPPLTTNTIITEIPYYSHLKYLISIYNETTENSTIKMKFIANYTADYNVISQYNGIIEVNYSISKIFSKYNLSTFNMSNITFLRPGIFNVTLLNDALCFHYPYIYPGLLYNSSAYYLYFVATKFNFPLGYVNETKVTINNLTLIAYKYHNLSTFSTINQYFYVLCNGIGYNFNYTFSYKIGNKTYNLYANFLLKCLSGNSSTQLKYLGNQLEEAFKPYVYLDCTYSSLYAGLTPNTYREIFYPYIFANGYFIYRYAILSFIAGQPVESSYFELSLVIGNYTDLPITFLVCNSSNIIWENEEFTRVNVTSLNILGKTYNNVIEYENISTKSFTILYFYNGTLIEEESGNIDGNSYNVNEKVVFVGNSMIPLNLTYPNYFDYTNTNLPYKAIDPSLALEVSIIITMIIVALIVLLYKRK